MRAVILAGVLMLAVAACGKSAEEKQREQAAEDLKKAAETFADAAQKAGTAAAAQGGADMAKAMQGMAAALSGTGPDGKPVEPVPFQTLQTHLPKVSGWEMRGEPDGQRMTSPVAYSGIEADYRKGKSNMEVEIVDTAFAQMLTTPFTMMMAAGYNKETTNGYEKATMVGGHQAMEKWDTRANSGELDVLIGKRFIVSIKGRQLADIQELHAFASAMDLGAIGALK